MSFLDLIFPRRCVGCKKLGDYLCANCFSFLTFSDSGFCVVCQRPAVEGLTHPVCKTRYEIDGVFSSLTYKGIVKKLVYQFKYPPYLLDLSGILVDLFYEGVIQKERFIKLLSGESIFISVPLHKNRMKTRGYNQSLVLAEGLVRKLREHHFNANGKAAGILPVVDLLNRVLATQPQFGLSQKDRNKNVSGAFTLNEKYSNYLKNAPVVFLVDDIVTTGATFREAGKVLKKAGAQKVFGVAMAHG